jgi:hypothetical protein
MRNVDTYNFELDMLTISSNAMFQYPMRSGLVGKSNHLRPNYLTPYVGVVIHSNLPNIMHVATKAHVVLRRYVVLTWMHDNK